jgi:hypothetical protein
MLTMHGVFLGSIKGRGFGDRIILIERVTLLDPGASTPLPPGTIHQQ